MSNSRSSLVLVRGLICMWPNMSLLMQRWRNLVQGSDHLAITVFERNVKKNHGKWLHELLLNIDSTANRWIVLVFGQPVDIITTNRHLSDCPKGCNQELQHIFHVEADYFLEGDCLTQHQVKNHLPKTKQTVMKNVFLCYFCNADVWKSMISVDVIIMWKSSYFSTINSLMIILLFLKHLLDFFFNFLSF